MILPAQILRAALRGEVTQARRPMVGVDPYYRQTRKPKATGRSRVLVRPFNPQPGDRLPLQHRVMRDGKPSTETHGHAVVIEVTQRPAGELSFEDARNMGYRTTSDAMNAWLEAHDPGWPLPDDQPACQACGGPGVATDGYCVTCGCVDQPAARFAHRHAHRIVWVIRFGLDTSHVPRLLAALPGSEGDADGDYVTSPSKAMTGLADAGEALSATDHERHVQSTADRTHEQWLDLEHAARAAELEQLSLGRRLDRAIAEAQARGVSVSREVNVIEKRLKALERHGHARAA